jgi:polygalacturonase
LATPYKEGAVRAVDEDKLDTERIQRAIDECGAGKAVELSIYTYTNVQADAGVFYNAFLTGPLDLREGVTLLLDKGVTLFASRDPKVFDMAKPGEPQRCGTAVPRPKDVSPYALNGGGKPKGGCRALININAAHAAVMGEGTIDGRGYAKLIGHDYSWWEMARRAQPKDDFYFSVRLIVATHADGLVLYGIHLVNSPNFHVTVGQTDGFTAWGVHLQTPVDKSVVGTQNDARNTDGIDPGTSTNITVAHSWIDNDDDNIAIKQGVTHMSVIDNHFYSGHGMSIGSETIKGQSQLLVDGLTLDHTTTGIRIKSNVVRGGPVQDAVYRNICMRGVKVPISISPYYENHSSDPFEDPKLEGDNIPDYKGLRLENVYSETPGDVLIAGLNDKHRTEITLENVHVSGIQPGQKHLAYVDLRLPGCPAHNNLPATNILPKDHLPATVKVMTLPAAGCGAYPIEVPDPCAGKFVPYQ